MLTLGIIGAVVLPILALVAYVVHKSKPGRFRLSATLLKLISIDIEVDAKGKTDELPPSVARLGITDTPVSP